MNEDLSKLLSNQQEEQNVPVTEYWQVLENSTGVTMDLFLNLFIPKCGILLQNKPIEWNTIYEKVIQLGVLVKTQYDCQVEDLIQRLHTIEAEVAELELAELDEAEIEGML